MIHIGDCLEVMPTMEPESFTACVTDPPYGLEFMGKDWDKGVPGVHFWAEVLRLLKPGGMLLAFGGTRTFHRLTCAIEDAGFDIRDCIAYMYGSGFPKSMDISKAIDKAAGDERPVIGSLKTNTGMKGGNYATGSQSGDVPVTSAASAASAAWEGYGTALKPAWEPVIVAMKPLSGTFAQNAQTHGVAGVNVEGCRIAATGRPLRETDPKPSANGSVYAGRMSPGSGFDGGSKAVGDTDTGRWPANVVLDEESAKALDDQTGELTSGNNPAKRSSDKHRQVYGGWKGEQCLVRRATDSGGASRFFYTSKVSPEERGSCTHPTMKPLDLMRWLLTLVTMPTGTKILDPFAGSGTTLVAAAQLGIEAEGIELSPEYAAIAERRIADVTPSLFRKCNDPY